MLHRYYYLNQAISGKDCDDFISSYKEAEFQKGKLQDCRRETVTAELYRQSNIFWIEKNNVVVRALWSCVLETNQNYQFNLSGYEKAQLTRYDKDDFYGWHQDSGYDQEEWNGRKLSAILQLSKPEDYEGCELQLFNGDDDLEELPIKNQGSVIVFRSEEWHRVTPLVKGVRYSLVFWANGAKLI